MTPDDDAPDAADDDDDDDAYPYYLQNPKNKENRISPNTDDPDAAYDYDASPDSRILYLDG